jgi:amino acid adenylation domain-containing protein/non-ribosomal peptide synthase protein (TIGR01720 family)
VIHHLAVDGVSWRILLDDLQTICAQLGRGEIACLPRKTSSFKQWAQRLTDYAASDLIRQEAGYWLEMSREPLTSLPVDRTAGENIEATLESVSVKLNADETRALLQEVPKTLRVQINDLLLGALAAALRGWAGGGSLLVDVEGHGRQAIFEDIDLSRSVGWFTSICPMVLDLDDASAAARSLARRRQQIASRGIGYGIARYLSNDREISGSSAGLPDAQVVFNYLGQLYGTPGEDALFKPLAVDNENDRGASGKRTHLLEIDAHVSEGQLTAAWSYSREVHNEATIARAARDFVEALRTLTRQVSPAQRNFPLAELSESEVSAVLAGVPLEEVEDVYPLSSTQQGLFFHALRSPESGAYFEQLTATLDGELDVAVFEQAWERLIERQPIFRTAFVWEESWKEPVQIVRRRAYLRVERDDWRRMTDSEKRERIDDFLARDRANGFHLARTPLARIALVRLTDTSYQFTFSFHHLLLDGWSVPLVFKELFAIYHALRSGSGLPEAASHTYRDYIAWLRSRETSQMEAYWRRSLKGITSPTRLPASSASHGGLAYGRQTVRLPENTTAALQSLARQNRVTLNSLLLAAWSVVLSRYSESDDIICGVTAAGRPSTLPGVEGMLGLFINTLPMRLTLPKQGDMMTWCGQLQEQQVEWREYEHSPLVEVHGWSEIPRSRPLFESIFVFENYPVDNSVIEQTSGLTVNDIHFVDQASYPLSVLVVPGTELLLGMGYDTARLNDAVVTQMLADYRGVVERIVKQPRVELSKLLPRPSSGDHAAIYEQSNLTKHQVLIWLGQKLHPQSPLYTLCVPFTIPATVDGERFAQAFQALIDRTDVLRTVVDEIHGIPQQRVLPSLAYAMEMLDFSSHENPAEELRRSIDERRNRPFELNRGLFDSALIRLREDKYVWYLAQHHIISDGWSIKLIFDTVARYYGLALAGGLDEASQLPQFGNYVAYERSNSKSARWLRAASYWKEKLSRNPGQIAFYGKTSFKRTTRVRRLSCELSEELSRRLRAPAEEIGALTADAALFNIFASIVCTWIHRASQKRDFRLGITSHNRPAAEFKQTIGFFMQVFPVDIRIEDGDSFASLIGKIKAELQQCLRHSLYTVENPVHAPTYEILFNYHNKDYTFDFNGAAALHDWTHPGHGSETFAFQVRNGNHSDAFVLDCDFHCDVFSTEQQAEALSQIRRVIDAFINDRNQPVGNISLLSENDQRRILLEFNQTDTVFPEGHDIADLFALQAEKRPDQVAVVCGDQSVTFARLNGRADRVAASLRSLGVERESVVTLMMHRGIDLLAAILGVFRAGGAYLPVDVSWPQRRTALVIQQSRSYIVLTHPDIHAELSASLGEAFGADCPRVVSMDDLPDNGAPVFREHAPAAMAYVIYTSGSTGMPKGVMVQHGGMMNHLNAKIKDLRLTAHDIVAQTASQCFDISVWQFLAALLAGGQVTIFDDATTHDPSRLLDGVIRDRVTVLETVPSMLGALLDEVDRRADGVDLPALRWLISTGEALEPRLLERWVRRFPRIPVCNAYGPTECSDDVSHHFVTELSVTPAVVPIGRPIANTRLYVLDEQLQPLPVGAAGEMCVGGAGVGRGYLGNPGKTAEVFVPDPFAVKPGARLYRTGDLARYDAAGTLEHLGRSDDQIKIRAFRIELGEIESTLASHPELRAAAVVAREDRVGHPYLTAYLVPNAERQPDIAGVREFLKERLPEVMVPAVFVTLPSLPLTVNGKVDRRALPAPEQNRAGMRESILPPRDDWELRLIRVWEELLDTRPIGVRDNFFESGGHSLLAVRLMFQIQKLAGRELPLALLFERPTIEELARVLREEVQVSVSSLVPIQTSGANPPLFFVHAHGGGTIAYYSLARHLGSDQPFYGLEAPGLDGSREPIAEISEMASHYIHELRRLEPQGPYRLGGHSFGGLVAFEMARQLTGAGERVELLAILDTAAPVDGNTPFDAGEVFADSDDATSLVEMAVLIERVVRRSVNVSLAELRPLGPEEQLVYFLEKLKAVDFVPPDADVSKIRGFLSVHRASSRASRAYVSEARPYRGPMTLFLSRDVAACDFRAQDRRLRNDPALGWGELVSGAIEVYTVPGDHIGMLNPPNVETLARELGACIRRANRNAAAKEVRHA